MNLEDMRYRWRGRTDAQQTHRDMGRNVSDPATSSILSVAGDGAGTHENVGSGIWGMSWLAIAKERSGPRRRRRQRHDLSPRCSQRRGTDPENDRRGINKRSLTSFGSTRPFATGCSRRMRLLGTGGESGMSTGRRQLVLCTINRAPEFIRPEVPTRRPKRSSNQGQPVAELLRPETRRETWLFVAAMAGR